MVWVETLLDSNRGTPLALAKQRADRQRETEPVRRARAPNLRIRTPATEALWHKFTGHPVLLHALDYFVYAGYFRNGHPVYVYRGPWSECRVWRKGRSWICSGYVEVNTRTRYTRHATIRHHGDDPHLPPEGMGWRLHGSSRVATFTFSMVTGFEEAVMNTIPWHIREYPTAPNNAKVFVVTILQCARRIAESHDIARGCPWTQDSRPSLLRKWFPKPPKPGLLFKLPPLPFEIWMMMLTDMTLADMVIPRAPWHKS
eukprot:m.376373 g.376373  ORF g.376373 m.376373 type:complete len:257 (-) comp16700_c1_seq3:164-934(-)